MDLLTKSKDEHDIIRSYYFQACRGVKLSTFSHKLEEFVLEGMKALALDSIIDVSPLRCIVRFFYGYDDFTIIKSAIGEKTGILYFIHLDTNDELTSYISPGDKAFYMVYRQFHTCWTNRSVYFEGGLSTATQIFASVFIIFISGSQRT